MAPFFHIQRGLVVCGLLVLGGTIYLSRPLVHIGMQRSTPIAALVARASIGVAATPENSRAPTQNEERKYAESVFASQAIDDNWARSSKRDLNARLEAIKADGIRLQEPQCRSSLCLVKFRSYAGPLAQQFVSKFLDTKVWREGPVTVLHEELESERCVEVSLYLARGSAALPRLAVK